MGEESKVQDTVKVKGYTKIYQFPSHFTAEDYLALRLHGELEKYLVTGKENTITAFGFNIIPIILSAGTDTVTHCAVGTGSPSATALGTEVGTRNAITYKFAINNEMHYDTFYGKSEPNSSSNALTEAGLFSQLAAGGEMYCSNTISFTKDTTVTMLIAWVWTFA